MKSRASRSIQRNLIVPLVILLVPILLIQGYFYYDLFRTRRATELQANLELARAVGVAFNSFVQDLLHQQISIAITATASPPISTQDLTKVLSRSAGYYDCVRNYSWVDPKGRVLASSSPGLIGMELSKKAHILEIESDHEWALSNLFLSDGTGEPIFSISHCVRNAQGSVLGMVVATVRADGLQEVLSIERAKNAGVSLVDRNGMVVATYPAREFTWEQRNWLERYPRKLKEAITGTELATTVTLGTGKKRLVGVAPIPSLGWVAAASRAEEDAMGAIIANLVTHGTLFLAVTLAAFATALALYRPISASISILRKQTLALGRGKIGNLDIASGPSEIKDLAEAFNKMAEKVRIREIALRNSEERFRCFMDNTPCIAWIKDEDGRYVYLNKTYEHRFGVLPQERLGKTDFEVWPHDIAEQYWKNDKAVLDSGRLIEVMEDAVNPDGGLGTWWNFRFPFQDASERKYVGGIGLDLTERRRAEATVRESEERLRNVLENMPVMMDALDEEANIIVWNRECERVTGYSSKEIVGNPRSLEMLYPDAEYRKRMMAELIDLEFDFRERRYTLTCKDGRKKTISWSNISARVPIPGWHTWAVGVDITELLLAEEALRESETKFRLIAENTADMISQHDPDGRILYASPSAVRILGYELEELIGSAPEIAFPKDDLATARRAIRRAVEKDSDRFRIQHRMRRKDGSIIWVETNGSLLYDQDCKLKQFQCLVRDMTERIRMEESLRESEERFRILAEKSLVGVYLIQNNLFRYVNPAFAQVLGYGCEEIIDRLRPGDTIVPEDREAVMESISRRISGERKADNREFRITRKDGTVREVEIYGVRVVHKDRPAILGTLIDITERKRMENELRLARDELENRVRERTAELALRNKELENFTFVAAHDLQEPLRKIQTFGDLVLNYAGSMNGQALDYVGRMRETALRMQEVLRSLLTYSRLTSRAEPFERVNLTKVAMEVVTDLELQIQEANASVEIEELPEIEADAGQMRQLFQNLLGNGLKFRREGEPSKVRVYAKCEQNDLGGECKIYFEDNGIGFEEKYLDKIFQPFQRLHGRKEYPGTGIGLAVCSKIADRHHGTITASSAIGKGSTFIVTLPARQVGFDREMPGQGVWADNDR